MYSGLFLTQKHEDQGSPDHDHGLKSVCVDHGREAPWGPKERAHQSAPAGPSSRGARPVLGHTGETREHTEPSASGLWPLPSPPLAFLQSARR